MRELHAEETFYFLLKKKKKTEIHQQQNKDYPLKKKTSSLIEPSYEKLMRKTFIQTAC